MLCAFIVNAQSPVKWKTTAKRIDDKTYELHCTATVSPPWHIYSQWTPKGGPAPTGFRFNKNPLITITGKVDESGTKITRFERVFGVDVVYFEGDVDFVQRLTLKAKAKTTVSGKITFMVCNDEQCLPPAEVLFSVVLQQC